MIGNDIAAALPDLRAQAESLMVDTVLVEVPAGVGPDPENPLKDIELFEAVYEGPGRWRTPSEIAEVDAAGTQVLVVRQELNLPVVASVAVRAGMRVTTTAAANDPAKVGTTSVIVRDATQSQPVQRRLVCRGA